MNARLAAALLISVFLLGCEVGATASACDWSASKAGTWTSTGQGTGCGIYAFSVGLDDAGVPKLKDFGVNANASVNVAEDTVDPKGKLEILTKRTNTCHLGCIKGADYDTALYLSCLDESGAKCTMEYKKQ